MSLVEEPKMIDELSFYKNLCSCMNAIVCVIDLDPYKLDWIAPTSSLGSLLGSEDKEINNESVFDITNKLFDAEFRKKLSDNDLCFTSGTQENWGGVTCVMDSEGLERWIVYSVGPFLRDADSSNKVIYIGIDVQDLFNTPATLNCFKDFINFELGKKFLDDLTQRQITVLEALTEGRSSNQIANDMGLSPHTIRDHKRALFRKFSCNSVLELVQIARMKGIVH